MKRALTTIWNWFDERLQIGHAIADVAEHPVPTKSASWFYVFGSAALTVFVLQIFTGILLATGLRAVRRRSVEQPAVAQSRRHARLVHARACTAGDRTSWSPIVLIHMCRCSCSAPTSFRAS